MADRQKARRSSGINRCIEVDKASGNAFADVGLPKQERLTQAELAIRIAETVRARHLNQIGAARILKIDQPRVSRLLSGQLAEFSTARLIYFLTLLGFDIEILVRPASDRRRQGQVRVVATTES